MCETRVKLRGGTGFLRALLVANALTGEVTAVLRFVEPRRLGLPFFFSVNLVRAIKMNFRNFFVILLLGESPVKFKESRG
jgi:hypothetical protein